MYTRLQNVDPPRENASGTSPSWNHVGWSKIANIIIKLTKLVTGIYDLWSRHYGWMGSTDESIEVDPYYSKFDSESMHQRGTVTSLRLVIQKAVRFQYWVLCSETEHRNSHWEIGLRSNFLRAHSVWARDASSGVRWCSHRRKLEFSPLWSGPEYTYK